MGKLDGLEPKKVFAFFEELCQIPHGSGNVKAISNYLVEFAKQRRLKYVQDHLYNVILFQPATEGYEKEPTLIIQGHMDMVAVKTPESTKDMTADGLELEVEGDYVCARDTSLGGDDGIALAYGLAILDSEDIPHPALELVFTVDEETGMEGAAGIDCSVLQGRRMLNLDSEEEGIFLSSCAGGMRADCSFRVQRRNVSGQSVKLCISGLWGGHSGCDIHLERGNANLMMARLLYALYQRLPFCLVRMEGGEADNVIPKRCEAEILFTGAFSEEAEKELDLQWNRIREAYGEKEPDCRLSVEKGTKAMEAVTKEDTGKCLQWMVALPNGVCAFAKEPKGLVETSLNMGVCHLSEGAMHCRFCIRSSVDAEKEFVLTKLKAICAMAGAKVETSGDYPGWKYQVHSPFREELVRIYEELFGKAHQVQAIHAGVECGFFAGKLPSLECVSLGPDILDIHTTDEKISISSVERVWKFLLRVLSIHHDSV